MTAALSSANVREGGGVDDGQEDGEENDENGEGGSSSNAVVAIAWCPRRDVHLLAACIGSTAILVEASGADPCPETQSLLDTASEAAASASEAASSTKTTTAAAGAEETTEDAPEKTAGAGKHYVQWSRWRPESSSTSSSFAGMIVRHRFLVRDIAWHYRGDYFSTVCPGGNTASVLVHQLSKAASQCPFRKLKGRVVRTLFHPSKPIFFVATIYHVRVYNLLRQTLIKKLQPNMNGIRRLAVHPGGDNLVVCAADARTAWLDIDLSTKPYKSLRHHSSCVHAASFHRSLPLFATAGDDANVHVFHGMVYADLLQNALIVPLKILRGHTVTDSEGVLDLSFHPHQPWLFTAGADGTARLFYN